MQSNKLIASYLSKPVSIMKDLRNCASLIISGPIKKTCDLYQNSNEPIKINRVNKCVHLHGTLKLNTSDQPRIDWT